MNSIKREGADPHFPSDQLAIAHGQMPPRYWSRMTDVFEGANMVEMKASVPISGTK